MVKIIADTTSCLSPEVAQKYNIPVIPQVINFGNDTYLEGVDMDIAAFMARLKASSELPKTAAPPPELFTAEFKKMQDANETILCIHPSAQVSGTVRSATVAAQDFPDADIRIIDTLLVSSPLGTLVQLAAEWAAEGVDADTIVARLEEMSARCRVYFMVDTLEYLAKGGRIGNASALIGTMLQMKPILTFKEGQVDQHDRTRTHKKAVALLKSLVTEQYPKDAEGYLSVMHAGVPEEARQVADDLQKQLGIQQQVPIFDMPPAIVTHGGPGILGAAFFVAA